MIKKKRVMKSERMLVDGTSLASIESLSFPLVQEIVISADISCCECQKRIADIMSRIKETESIEVNVLDKKVAFTCKYTTSLARRIPVIRSNPLNKMAVIRHIFGSPRSS